MESQHKEGSGVTVTADGKVVTADGLALKNLDRVEAISSRMQQRINAEFQSWQMCRMVRRDFNFVAAKMFHKMNERGAKDQIRGLVHEVRLHAELLAMECQSFEINPAPEIRSVPLRLISAASSSLYKALACADAAYTKLNFAVEQHRISPDDVHAYAQEFEFAFSDLKQFCTAKSTGGKSAQQLGVALGIA